MAKSNLRAIGRIGEDAVCRLLETRGCEILCRNYTIKGGEIDIIARQEEWLLFVEVKTRRQNALVSGTIAVNRQKQQRILQTALRYLMEHPLDLQPRFDVAEVEYTGSVVRHIHYIERAFDASSPNSYGF
ncbi:MAG: YraN family protein [Oscillospiraceae bacterium]|nr:YraN family protein [Oscillospiraceae bacterium]